MIEDGILDGDRVLLRPGVALENGEIAAVLVGSVCEATLKHVLQRPGSGRVTLRASNPRHRDRVVRAEELRIAGVYRGLVRHSNRRGDS